ncbi:MAG: signal peptide peptidase SppA [Bacteroidales bacterium]|nr:signal peptide peptidase SppA [Bacteroidales bacterium]
MKKFLTYVLATITGIIIVLIIFFFIMIGSLGALIATGEKPVTLINKNILILNAGVPIPDHGNPNPWAAFDIINMTFSPAPGLNEILNNIRKASSDPKITGILIENGLTSPGWATSDEIRNALKEFRKSGKFVLAYADYILTQEGYFLSTSANKVFLNPGAMMDFKGLSGEVMFYKQALEKLGIEVQVIRHGKFKGAAEPFMLDRMSNENREQIQAYVGAIWNHVISSISETRNISSEKLNSIADQLTATNPEGALQNGLIDGLIFRDQLIDTIKILSGLSTKDKIGLVPMTKYSRVPETVKKSYSKNKIALIYAEGNIVMGKGDELNIGGNHYADIIREIRKDSTIKAVVLRVNSPGGNAIASDIIWREVMLASGTKPVVISMGNYAASGGYYISVPGSKILASPVTITGSIGVFGLIPNANKLLKNKLGINTETVNTNKLSDFPSIYRSMSPYEKEVMQKSIEKTYSDFVTKVSEGRNISIEKVNEIAEGRVWDGAAALKIGLVDEFGGLQKSVEEAARLADLKDYSLKEYPVAVSPYEKLLKSLTGNMRMKLTARKSGDAAKYLEYLNELPSLSGIQARLPYFIEIR